MGAMTLTDADMIVIEEALHRYDLINFKMTDMRTPEEVNKAAEALAREDGKIAEVVHRRWWEQNLIQVIDEAEDILQQEDVTFENVLNINKETGKDEKGNDPTFDGG